MIRSSLQKIKEKLQDQKGASLLFSIVILMICVVLSGVILSAALVNLGKVERSRQEHQAYLTAESTALLFRDLFACHEITISEVADGSYVVNPANISGDFGEMLRKDIEDILSEDPDPDPDPDIPIMRILSIEDTEVVMDQKVMIDYKMNRGYGVEIEISVFKEDKILVKLQQDISATGKKQDDKTTIKWQNGMVTRMIGG